MAREIDRIGVDGVVKRPNGRVGSTAISVSIDIDVLGPAFAPATEAAEVGGWSRRELPSVLEGFEDIKCCRYRRRGSCSHLRQSWRDNRFGCCRDCPLIANTDGAKGGQGKLMLMSA